LSKWSALNCIAFFYVWLSIVPAPSIVFYRHRLECFEAGSVYLFGQPYFLVTIGAQITEIIELSIKNETYFYSNMFPNGTIRVVTPVTEDGNRPKLNDQGQQIWKEDFFPITAKRAFELQNARLPKHLKKIIEVVNNGDVPAVAPVSNQVTVAELPVVVKKRGPKPKVHA
jgi:hypothetical protein